MSGNTEKDRNDQFDPGTYPVDQSLELELPEPILESSTSIEQALAERQSVRSYSGRSLALSDVSQLLWAAQGITRDSFFRTAPSAGALYPLEVYLVVGNVDGVVAGVYRYVSSRHSMLRVLDGDRRDELCRVSLSQPQIRDAAAVVVIAADYSRTTVKYGIRGIRYAHVEVGFAAENVYLQGVSLGIGTCAVGAFDDGEVASILDLPVNEEPLLIMPIGYV
ncbi:SagB/ThcOx family dehydrogenase [Methanococcoides methylutens]|uniref:SagB/ThcOx family dehydrogenase n=1 Tax=Methanococcoides methylutens TaxID=2226 RepID=UPI00064F8A4B|nr:SagB/ThcOx family dehydrogenase [Methanococcoides methylutens]